MPELEKPSLEEIAEFESQETGLNLNSPQTEYSRRELFKRTGLVALNLAGGAFLFSSLESCVAVVHRKSDNFDYFLPETLTQSDWNFIIPEAEAGYKKVSEFLSIKTDRRISVATGGDIPWAYPDESRIVMPTSRMGKGKNRYAAWVHEITHILTGEAGIMLSEGLAVYMQEKFGTNIAYPTLGKELHSLVSTRPKDISITNWYMPSVAHLRADAYLVAGSFVKFLIEDKLGNDGKKFMEFYRSRNWQKYFGKSFTELAKEWGEKVRQYVVESSDLIYIEHLNPRRTPRAELDSFRKERVNIISQATSIREGRFYPMWIDLKLESRAKDPLEFSDIYIDNVSKGTAVDITYYATFHPRSIELIANIIGKRLNPTESKYIRDFPIGVSSTWSGSQFVVHYIYKNLVNSKTIEVPVITPKM